MTTQFARQPRPYYRYRVGEGKGREVSVGVGGVAEVTLIERGTPTAKVAIWHPDGIALAKSVNAGVGTWGVLADWIEERVGSDSLHVHSAYPADSPAVVAAALRGVAG